MPSLQLLRNPVILSLWSAQLLSVVGDRFFALAIMWVALERSGPVAMGLVAIVESVPFILLGMVGQPILLRCNSFPRLGVIDAVRALVVAVLPMVWAAAGTPAMLVLVAVLGICAAVFDPCLAASAPALVPEPDRPALVALMDLTTRLARIAGPAVAALLLLVVPPARLFEADAATFLVSAAALIALGRRPTGAGAARPGDQEQRPVRAGQLLRAHPALWSAYLVFAVGYFFNALPGIGLPVLLSRQLGASPTSYGLLLTATGVAALAGNAWATRLGPDARFPRRIHLAWLGSGAALCGLGAAALSPVGLPGVAAAAIGFAALGPVSGIGMGSYLASFEAVVRLRLISMQHTVIRGSGTAGMVAVPVLLADRPAEGFLLGGAIVAACAAAGWASSRHATTGRWMPARVVEHNAAPVSRE